VSLYNHTIRKCQGYLVAENFPAAARALTDLLEPDWDHAPSEPVEHSFLSVARESSFWVGLIYGLVISFVFWAAIIFGVML